MSEPSSPSIPAWALMAAQLVRREPMTLADLRHRLGPDVAQIPTWDLLDQLDLVQCTSVGDLVAHDELILGDAVMTHRVSRDEARRGYLLIDPDLALLTCTWAPRRPLLSGGWAKQCSPYDVGAHDRPPSEQVLTGPKGWLGGAKGGDLVGLSWQPDALDVVRVEPSELVEDDVCDVLSSCFDELCDDDGATSTWRLAALAAIRRPGLWHAPRPPLIELLARAGLCTYDDEVAPTGFDWDALWRARYERAMGTVLPHPQDEGGRILPFSRP